MDLTMPNQIELAWGFAAIKDSFASSARLLGYMTQGARQHFGRQVFESLNPA
jgi:hypothetical protein